MEDSGARLRTAAGLARRKRALYLIASVGSSRRTSPICFARSLRKCTGTVAWSCVSLSGAASMTVLYFSPIDRSDLKGCGQTR
jgi:hypothetical protein